MSRKNGFIQNMQNIFRGSIKYGNCDKRSVEGGEITGKGVFYN